ncbi:hypothetical protein RBB50_005557 [Rhinocladiella similis]
MSIQTKSPAPDDQLSPTSLYYRSYFRNQDLSTPASWTSTPPEDRIAMAEANRALLATVQHLLVKPKNKTNNQRTQHDTIEPKRQGGITKSRKPARRYLRHTMITRTRSLSTPGFRLFDLQHPPPSDKT